MTRVLHRPRADEALIPCATAHPTAGRPPAQVGSVPPKAEVAFDDLPDPVTKQIDFSDMAEPDEPEATTVQPARKPLGWGPAMLTYLRTQDTTPSGLGMRPPAAPKPKPQPAPRPLPGIATIAYLSAVSVAIQADYVRHLDTLRILDEISAAAPDQHTLTMLLAPIAAELAPFADAVKAGA